MILRSQLRMNKNIVFPFISCIMIVFTLLVLLHKSADELMTVKKEMNHCKEQYENTFTQLQNAIELKLRLEKSLENEKSDGKQKLDNKQTLLDQERKDREKDKNDANVKYDSLNEELKSLKTENADLKDQIEKSKIKNTELEKELKDKNSKLEEVNEENERKNQIIRDLQEQPKSANVSASMKKAIPSEDPGLIGNERLKVALVQNSMKDRSSTPNINPAAVNNQQVDDSPKQVIQPPDTEQENSAQKEMHESLNMGIAEQIKSPQENVGKAPSIRNEDDERKSDQANHDNVNGEVPLQNDEKEPGMVLKKPPNFEQQNKPASSVSNNAAENPEIGPVQPAGPKILPNQKKGANKMKDYPNAEYDNNMIPEDEGEMEYQENGIRNRDTN